MSETSARALPAVTVIVPVYNGAATIAACIESLLAQAYPSDLMEIVVVDNNSTDGSAEIVRSYPVRLAHERVQTPYAARNRGIELSQAEIYAFTDADCIAETNWLSNLVQPFEDPRVGAAGGRVASHLVEPNLVQRYLAQTAEITRESFAKGEPLRFSTQNAAYRQAALTDVGLFDAAMFGGGDIELAWRVQGVGGYAGVYVDDAVVYHHHRSTLRGVFGQYRRYGFSEITLTTLYAGCSFHQRTPAYELKLMGRQGRAMVTYILSIGVRLTRVSRWRVDPLYLASPAIQLVIETGNLLGKLSALLRTRFIRRSPYSTSVTPGRRCAAQAVEVVDAD
jgi:cellulose synthase/poly-beta-1,6-N-acetylglucosamine synthase-like glycosyltransferase